MILDCLGPEIRVLQRNMFYICGLGFCGVKFELSKIECVINFMKENSLKPNLVIMDNVLYKPLVH